LAGPVFYPFATAREALALYRDFATSIPDEVNTVAALMNSPDGDPLAAIVLCYNGDLAFGEKILRPLRSFGPPVADQVAPTPYRKVQTFFDEAFIRGRRYYFKSNFTRSISDEAVATLVEQFATAPSPLSMLYFQQLGNAANRVGATETAFSHRDALCEWGCDAVWLDPADDAANILWARQVAEAMRPFTSGTQILAAGTSCLPDELLDDREGDHDTGTLDILDKKIGQIEARYRNGRRPDFAKDYRVNTTGIRANTYGALPQSEAK
jgi:hypothetical protein